MRFCVELFLDMARVDANMAEGCKCSQCAMHRKAIHTEDRGHFALPKFSKR